MKDVEASVAWHVDVLGLERRMDEEWGSYPAVLSAGDSFVMILQSDEPRTRGKTIQHCVLRVDRASFERAQELFHELRIPFRFGNYGVSHSVYIDDPDGHAIEITTYELGDVMQLSGEPTLEWTIHHVKDYLEGRIDVWRFWKPFPPIVKYYDDYPEDPADRLCYFWRRNMANVMAIAKWGNAEAEPGYRDYLTLWLDALLKPEEEWHEIVKRRGEVLQEYDPDWDK